MNVVSVDLEEQVENQDHQVQQDHLDQEVLEENVDLLVKVVLQEVGDWLGQEENGVLVGHLVVQDPPVDLDHQDQKVLEVKVVRKDHQEYLEKLAYKVDLAHGVKVVHLVSLAHQEKADQQDHLAGLGRRETKAKVVNLVNQDLQVL